VVNDHSCDAQTSLLRYSFRDGRGRPNPLDVLSQTVRRRVIDVFLFLVLAGRGARRDEKNQ